PLSVILLLASIIFSSAKLYPFEKQADGVLFEIIKQEDTDAQWVKIQVCTEDIIRVIASPVKSFSERPSLMVNKTKWEETSWTLNESGDIVEIATSKLIVKVNSKTGAVAFYDVNGKTLLEEKPENGKIISSAEVMGEQTYHVQQFFNSPADEAFYGLGAHQNDVWNYKNHDVDLWQLNIIDVIPFLVSSNNYGILWDNNSRTKFGDIRDYQPISDLKLYDKNGAAGGLTAEYYKDEKFENLLTSKIENRINHEFIDVNDPYPARFLEDVKSVRWSGEIECNETGIHKFQLYSCFYTKLWIDDKLIVDSWRQNWLPWTTNEWIDMQPGQRHKIKIEWIPNGGYIGFNYLPPEKQKCENCISLYSEVADQIDYYFIKGDNIDGVIKGYRTITGKAPMMPDWALGLWQSRQRYKTQNEIIDVVTEFRKRKIPFDNIVLDWFYWEEDKWGSHDFDLARFPNAETMVKELHNDLHSHIMISVWAKFYVGTKHYDEFNLKGWLYKRNVEVGQKDWVGPGYVSTFYDPYNDAARELFWKQINDKLFSKGIDAWWLDSTEPDIQSNLSMKETELRMGPTALGTSARYRNTFSLMNSKGVYEGQRKTNPDQRVFILTRSAFAGQQRYAAATWSGDLAARWYDLKAQISAGLNFCISGIPYWTTDIGGFAVEPRYEKPTEADLNEWRELNTRWFQFGAFCPLLRSHGEFPYREMFNIAPDDHPAYQTMLAYDKLRYRLMPYIYSLTGIVTQNDYTIMRALVMDFGYDTKVKNIGDQFMFGPSILINPVYEYKARARQLYLPAGTGWYEMKSGQYYCGGVNIKVDAPYTDIPIFIKQGSIIPCGPELQYVSEKPADPIRLFVYTGSDASFELYEDEGTNYNYEKGHFTVIPITYNEANHTLTIGDRKGKFNGMLESRTFEIVLISSENPSGLNFEIKPDEVVNYNGSSIKITMK
ncbi:MAG: TIM-barrel domain-containing protein, partial [bacterium]